MKKVKLAAILVLSVAALVVVLENTKVVTTKVLFWPVDMSLALLLILTSVLGFVIGALVASGLLRKKRGKV